jgi:DNA polymerase
MTEGPSKEKRMEALAKRVAECTGCPLYSPRRRVVVGEGNLDALIMFIGEAPGYYEDLQGRPFVGAAGKVLDRLLEEIGIERKGVYITNLVKRRPPGNRAPRKEEIEACSPFLDEQLDIIRPKVIVPLGRFSTEYLMEKFGLKPAPISVIHGRPYDASAPYGPVLIFPLYHPAVVLYKNEMEKELFEDARRLKEVLSKRGYI